MRSQIDNRRPQILIAGGGPAGSSLAVRLARLGLDVTLIEKERFPRHKLCGEFISPECLAHFDELGVGDRILACGGAAITETVFFERGGRSVAVPSSWLGHGPAISLSRARMDECLLRQAAAAGVRVFEAAHISGVEVEGDKITSLNIRIDDADERIFRADVFIDATGRQRVLSRLTEKSFGNGFTSYDKKEKLVAFKVHLKNTEIPTNRCEIYSFSGGYAGLSPIEEGLANLCMIVRPAEIHDLNHDRLIADVVAQNLRASEVLGHAEPVSEWLAVAVHKFGRQSVRAATNLFSVGDAAAFIDPFTGSGMLMAMEGSRALANAFADATDLETIAEKYSLASAKLFRGRLRISSVLRHAAFSPGLATATVQILRLSAHLRRHVARSTRGHSSAEA